MTCIDVPMTPSELHEYLESYVWFDDSTVLDYQYALASINHTGWGTDTTIKTDWWLVDYSQPDNPQAVAYLRTLHGENMVYMYGAYLILCDIETNPDRRGSGHVSKIIEGVEQIIGDVMHTTGNCTPSGYAALNGRLPLTANSHYSIAYRDMTFVADWTYYRIRA